MIPAALLSVAVIAAAIVITSQHREPAYGPQVTLPFTGLNGIDEVAPVDHAGVAVDTAGNLYVVDGGNNRVLELAAGSATQAVLPFTGLNHPGDMAVDTAGNLYVADSRNSRVLKLAAGSAIQTVLPFTGLKNPTSVAVDTAGNLYVIDTNSVVKLAAGSATQTVLPQGERGRSLTGLLTPHGIAVDTAGNLYITPGNWVSPVVKLAAGSATQTVLPFTGLNHSNGPNGVAVDAAGNVYVTDVAAGDIRVLKLPVG